MRERTIGDFLNEYKGCLQLSAEEVVEKAGLQWNSQWNEWAEQIKPTENEVIPQLIENYNEGIAIDHSLAQIYVAYFSKALQKDKGDSL